MSKIKRIWVYGADRTTREWVRAHVIGPMAITKDKVVRLMRRRVLPRFWVFMIVVTLAVFCASFAVMRVRYAQGSRRLAGARANRDQITLQVSALSDKLEFAQTDDYVIRTARDELGMIMPGEVRYVNGA